MSHSAFQLSASRHHEAAVPGQTQRPAAELPNPRHGAVELEPRVYLLIEKTGRAKCPYCGADYILEGD